MNPDYASQFHWALVGAYVAAVRARQAADQPVLPSPVDQSPVAPELGAALLGQPAGGPGVPPAGPSSISLVTTSSVSRKPLLKGGSHEALRFGD